MPYPTDKIASSGPQKGRAHLSRRTVVLAASALLGVGSPALAMAAASEKTPKSEAGYKDTPNGGARCDGCAQFLAPSNCKLVTGPVSPSGWCNFFTPRPR